MAPSAAGAGPRLRSWLSLSLLARAGSKAIEATVRKINGMPAVEVLRLGAGLQPMDVDDDLRRPLPSLTGATVVRSVGQASVGRGHDPIGPSTRTPQPQPALGVSIDVGAPAQRLAVALDTTGGTTWLMRLGPHDLADDVALYRPLGSLTARHVTASERRPVESVPLAPLAPRSVLVGHVVADLISLAGVTVPRQRLLLAKRDERLPAAVWGWAVAGVLGLGVRAGACRNAAPPFLESWRTVWINGPAGDAWDPVAAALQDEEVGDAGPAANQRLPPPMLSIWPEARPKVANASATKLWLGHGSIHGAAWTSLSSSAGAGWAAEGHVSASDVVGASNVRRRWVARLLIDTTTPFLGVPARHFSELLFALLPNSTAEYCWWHQVAELGVQVRCECSAAARAGLVTIEVAGRALVLGAADIFVKPMGGDAGAAEACVALLRPVAEPGDVWRLGEPFLARHAVTLDYGRRRLGFAPPLPPQPVVPVGIVEELRGSVALPYHSESNDIGRTMLAVAPDIAFWMLVSLALAALLRGVAGRQLGLMTSQRDYLAVAMAPPLSDEDLST